MIRGAFANVSFEMPVAGTRRWGQGRVYYNAIGHEPADLTGTVRDFQERRENGGHTDFEYRPAGGFGHYMGIVSDYLGEDEAAARAAVSR